MIPLYEQLDVLKPRRICAVRTESKISKAREWQITSKTSRNDGTVPNPNYIERLTSCQSLLWRLPQ